MKKQIGYMPELPPAVRGHDRPRLPLLRLRHQGRAPLAAQGEHGPVHGDAEDHRRARAADQEPLQGLQAARRASPRPSSAPRRCSSSTSRPSGWIPSRSSRRGTSSGTSGKEHTIILSSHILPEVQAVCSRVLIINRGKIVASDTPENLSRGMTADNRLTLRVAGAEAEALAVARGRRRRCVKAESVGSTGAGHRGPRRGGAARTRTCGGTSSRPSPRPTCPSCR